MPVTPDTTPQTLPVLPLNQGVVLPQMVVTIALETDEAKAVAAAAGPEGTVLLVPRVEGRYARVGAVATIEDRGPLPNGTPAMVIRAERRARVGAGVVGAGDALWVQAELVDDDVATDRTDELAREYRAAAGLLLERLGGRRMGAMLRDVESPGALADTAGWWPDLSTERKIELLETIDVDERLEMVTDWVKEALAEAELSDRIRTDVSEGMEKTQREFLLRQQLAAIRRELGEGDEDGEGVDAYRQRLEGRDIPTEVAAAIDRELGRLERTNPQAAETGWIRTWLDTIIELPWGVRSDDHLDLADARAVLDADHSGWTRSRTASSRTWPCASCAWSGAWARRSPCHPGAGRPARGGQDLAGRVGGPRPGPDLRPRGPGGRARRGRDPWPSPHLRGGPARPHRAGRDRGQDHEPRLPAGRDRQGGQRLAWRPVVGPARGAGPGAEPLVPGPLPGGRPRPVRRAVHRHRQQLDTIPAPLLDRMEVITLDGYTDEEKVTIARDHLLARQLERNGLRPDEVGGDR